MCNSDNKKKYLNLEDTDTSSVNSSSNNNSGAFIDHRQYNDLAHIHSSPARTRRRHSQLNSGPFSNFIRRSNDEHLPLTNKNLQNFNSTSESVSPTTSKNFKSIAIDMDKYAREQSEIANTKNNGYDSEEDNGFIGHGSKPRSGHGPHGAHTHRRSYNMGTSFSGNNHKRGNDNDSIDDGMDNFSINSLEFGESNPSSEHSSDSTSLDDVCFPDYYAEAPEPTSAEWPDLKVLKEFIQFELAQLTDDAHNDYEANFHNHTSNGGGGSRIHRDSRASEHVNFKPILPVKRVESNDIDTESFKSKHSFQVTPTPIHPGDKTSRELTATAPILNKAKPKEDICRFTYFRDDLTKTIHSPNLSGLLMNNASTNVKEQPNNLTKKWRDDQQGNKQGEDQQDDDKFMNVEDLFQPLYYSNVDFSSQTLSQHPLTRQFQGGQPASGVLSPSGIATPNPGNVHSQEGGSTPLVSATATGTATGTGTGTGATGPVGAPSSTGPTGPTGSSETPLKNVVGRTGLTNTGTNNSNLGGGPSVATDINQTPHTGTITDSIGAEVINPFWLDVFDPTEEEMKVLSKTFGIHPLTTEDIFLGEAREKVELFKSYYFICFTSFDVVYERRKQRIREHERKISKLQELNEINEEQSNIFRKIFNKLSKKVDSEESLRLLSKGSSSHKSTGKKVREGELSPLSMYMIVFKHGVITFHFSPTPHPINVRRRVRLLKDYLTVSADWISYALIDDITDSFAPMIESIEEEVNSIEEAILRMHAGDNDSDSEEDSDSDSEYDDHDHEHKTYGSTNEPEGIRRSSNNHRATGGGGDGNKKTGENIFFKRPRSKSIVDKNGYRLLDDHANSRSKTRTNSKSSSSSSKSYSKILGWKRKGDMLRRIGECRKRVMSVLRLLGSKADVIKGFSKRLNETELSTSRHLGPQSKLEISMYLGDIQDHIITMVQSLNHYEKLLARFHSNYLAQINIDMTKVNNDTNDVLGKITILGTIVLPINVVTGLWGMNCLVPGQDYDGLAWFWSIIGCMVAFSIFAYNYAKRAYGI